MLRARGTARRHLIPFTEFTFPSYAAAAHHHLIASRLEAVADGKCPRLIIAMPPRHGKSELASRRWPAWLLGRNPKMQVIAASYGADLARDFGREVRNLIRDESYQAVFPGVALAQDSSAANRWHTDAGGVYMAVGVGTATTGRGADVLIIDDPLKDRLEADSQLMRDRAWDWYRSVAYTRLMPGASVVMILTRWHEDDPAGRLLRDQEEGGDQWEVISLPAINEAGEALWPDRYPLETLKRIRGVIGKREWSALYQQKPAPDEGTFFLREWLKSYTKTPARDTLRVYGASDYAVTSGGGDYTVHIVVGVDPDWNMYVLDLWRGQTDSAVWIEVFCDLVTKWKPLEWAEETGQIRAGLGPFIDRRQIERKSYVYRRVFPTRGDKAIRAQSIRGRMAQHGLYVPANAEWAAEFERELMIFDAGMHDDQVDALGLIGQLLDHIAAGTKPKRDKPPVYPYMAIGEGRIRGTIPIRKMVENRMRQMERDE